MKRYLLALLIFLAVCIGASAQTTVGGTVTDTDSQTWNNGSITFSTNALGTSSVTGTLSATGTYSGVSIPHTAATAAVGDVWTVAVCPTFVYPCFKTTAVITGATQTLNVTPSGPRINVAGAIPEVAAYNETELVNTYIGLNYLNVNATPVQRACTSLSGGNCVWTNFPGNATSGNCNVNSASPAACGSSASGVIVVPTTTTSYTVNTTAVTANSRIQVLPITDNSGVTGSPTCNAPPTPFIGYQSARVAGTSFTFTLPSTSGTSCWIYEVIN